MPFCYRCGKEIGEQAKFCHYCGFKISADVAARLSSKKQEEPEQKSKKKGDIKINVDVFEEKQSHRPEPEQKEPNTENAALDNPEEESFGWVWIIIAGIVLIIIGIIVYAVVSGSLALPGV